MILRITLAFLVLAMSSPVEACPFLEQPQSAHDCCPKGPQLVKVEPCFDCVADVRSTAIVPEIATDGIVLTSSFAPNQFDGPELLAGSTERLPDNSGTYLRLGVLRI
jgi:hypothetical protein